MTDDFSRRTKTQDVARWFITRFVEGVAEDLPAGTSVLDAGAGESVYRKLFAHCQYRAIDLAVGVREWNYANLDYVAPLDDMPIASDSFDAVLCTQVLEHLEHPRESVVEMHRVLKPGGRLFITAPMAQAEHQTPYDFFRYTSFGLTSLCTTAGFREVTVNSFGGRWVRWAYELPEALWILPLSGLRSGRPNPVGVALLPLRLGARLVAFLLQHAFLGLDRFDSRRDFPFGWSCVATK